MATRSIHCKLGVVDQYGNIVTISPKTTGDDVYIRENQFKKGTTLQALINNLGNIAYTSDFMGIGDNDTGNKYKTWSANKIRKEFNDVSVLNNRCLQEFKNNTNTIISMITAKGVPVTKETTIQELCTAIQTIYDNYYISGKQAGDNIYQKGTATPDDGMQGVSWMNSEGKIVSGNIIPRGSKTIYLSSGQSDTLVEGYYVGANYQYKPIQVESNDPGNLNFDLGYVHGGDTITVDHIVDIPISPVAAESLAVYSVGVRNPMIQIRSDYDSQNATFVKLLNINVVNETNITPGTSVYNIRLHCYITLEYHVESPRNIEASLRGLFTVIYGIV